MSITGNFVNAFLLTISVVLSLIYTTFTWVVWDIPHGGHMHIYGLSGLLVQYPHDIYDIYLKTLLMAS